MAIEGENERSKTVVEVGIKRQSDDQGSEPRWMVFIDNLSRRVPRGAFWELFSHYGKILQVFVSMVNKKRNYRSTTFAFVRFAYERDMNLAIAKMNNSRIDGKIISIFLRLDSQSLKKGVLSLFILASDPDKSHSSNENDINCSPSDVGLVDVYINFDSFIGKVEPKRNPIVGLNPSCSGTLQHVLRGRPFPSGTGVVEDLGFRPKNASNLDQLGLPLGLNNLIVVDYSDFGVCSQKSHSFEIVPDSFEGLKDSFALRVNHEELRPSTRIVSDRGRN
ncbi:hypothetical protein V6N13_106578 [Hibiscus sabdariffa]|uniref:RRM domain-containing protein n=1 Tax=Hibiscus sabdariffa TaxID=183260 RepID=A0ABR2F143_9ROSI